MKKILIGKKLLENSKFALINGIEVYNKPISSYRFELSMLLLINAWELILKAYIYKHINKKKALFENGKDGKYTSFNSCLDLVCPHIGGKNFNHIKENVGLLYKYRNQVVHSYGFEYDTILHSLATKTIVYYREFYEKYFGKILFTEQNLILLPLGGKKIISPIEFLSNKSSYSEAPIEIQNFIKDILISTKTLADQDIEDTVIETFQVNLTSSNKIKNVDIIAKLDEKASITITKLTNIKISDDENSTKMTFNSTAEEKKFQDENYQLTYKELRSKITAKYPNQYRYVVQDLITEYKENPEFAYACRGKTQYKYNTKLIDEIGNLLQSRSEKNFVKQEAM